MTIINPQFADRLKRAGHTAGSRAGFVTATTREAERRTGFWWRLLSLFLGLLLAAALFLTVWVDYAVYDARAQANGDNPRFQHYLTTRLTGGPPSHGRLQIAARDYEAQPLSFRERAALTRHLASALPDAPEGWVLRPFTASDEALLRPDLAHCLANAGRIDAETFYRQRKTGQATCPLVRGWNDVWVYARGDQRIAMHLHYRPARTIGAFVCIPRPAVAQVMLSAFGGSYATRPVAGANMLDTWRFGRLPRLERQPDGSRTPMPLRMFADQTGHGTLSVFVMANAPQSSVNRVLDGLNFDLMNAMVTAH